MNIWGPFTLPHVSYHHCHTQQYFHFLISNVKYNVVNIEKLLLQYLFWMWDHLNLCVAVDLSSKEGGDSIGESHTGWHASAKSAKRLGLANCILIWWTCRSSSGWIPSCCGRCTTCVNPMTSTKVCCLLCALSTPHIFESWSKLWIFVIWWSSKCIYLSLE